MWHLTHDIWHKGVCEHCLKISGPLWGLARYSVHFTATVLKKIIAPLFVTIGPPPLGSKWTEQTQLSDSLGCLFLFSVFHLVNVLFVQTKLENGLFGCSGLSSNKITPWFEKVLIKMWCVLKCCGCWLSDGWIEKTVLHQNNWAWWDFAQNCKYSQIFRKIKFLFSPWNFWCD